MLVSVYHKTYCYKTILIKEQDCPVCMEKKANLKLLMMLHYNEMFAIIRFPLEKFGVLECNSCLNTIPERKWALNINSIYQEEKEKMKTPNFIWSWVWIVPLILIGGYLLLYLIAVILVDSH
jgi:hypothetical protein